MTRVIDFYAYKYTGRLVSPDDYRREIERLILTQPEQPIERAIRNALNGEGL